MDVEAVDQEYQQLQQESQQLTQAIQGFATKLQAAGDAQAKEWVLDLKDVALQIQQEQLQMQALLQALHGLMVNSMQQVPQAQAAAPVQAAAPQPQQGGGTVVAFHRQRVRSGDDDGRRHGRRLRARRRRDWLDLRQLTAPRQMPDRYGTILRLGDPVLYWHAEETSQTATLLRDLGENNYLIQLDPKDPATRARVQAVRDQVDAARSEASLLGVDLREPFVASADQLEYFGAEEDERR